MELIELLAEFVLGCVLEAGGELIASYRENMLPHKSSGIDLI